MGRFLVWWFAGEKKSAAVPLSKSLRKRLQTEEVRDNHKTLQVLFAYQEWSLEWKSKLF